MEHKDYTIEWDMNTLVCIAEEGGYPRLRKLIDKSLLVVYENRRGDIVAKKSYDEGATWRNLIVAYEAFDFSDEGLGETIKVDIANPEIIQLKNGDILLAVNLRPQKEGVFPFSIALKRSEDNGESWSESTILYQAGTYFRDGCWEPSFLLLPDGSIHLYFANESPYLLSDEQEISMLYSLDNGISWSSEYTTVSFRKGKRDGMPVAVHDSTSIYIAIEDNISKEFKPYIISNLLENEWSEPVNADSPFRYYPLNFPLSEEVYAGAPYLIRTDNGLYILSYQTTERRSPNWELSTMEVVLSNKPFGFGNPSRPFNVPLDKEAKWNSLADLGDNSIMALSSTNFNDEKIGVWMIKGIIQEKME